MTNLKSLAALLLVTLVTACAGPSKSTVGDGATQDGTHGSSPGGARWQTACRSA